MDYLLVAHSMRLEADGDVFSLVFADGAQQPGRYVLLQKSLAPGAQDAGLELDGLQLEIDDQSHAAYRAIACMDVREDRARLVLTGHGQSCLGVDSVVIAFAGTDLRAPFGALAGVVDGEFPIRVSDAPPARP